MGAWKRVLCGMLKTFRGVRLIFVGNGSDQTGSADIKSEKIKRHVTCRPHLATRPEREVLIEI